jgi:hypothetical protein
VTFELLTPIVLSAQAKLEADLPDVLAELRTAHPTLDLADPSAVLDYVPHPASLVNLASGPVLGVMDLPSELEDDIGSAATGRHRWLVVVHMVHADQRLLAWQLRLYLTAVVRVFEDRYLPDVPGFMAMGCDGTIPGDTLGREEDPQEWQTWAGVQFWTTRDEQ